MKLIRYGTYLALNQELPQLNLNLLAEAFDQYVKADKPGKINPFLRDKWENLELVPPGQNLEVGATSGRMKSKSKSLKSAQVLRSS
jgi:hypothetical protein